MKMRLRPGTKRSLYFGLATLVVYYIFLKKRRYTEVIETVHDSVEPKTLWEFWADFSNWQKINPTLINFEIEYEKGNYENWEYAITYVEHLVHLPFIKHYNRGVFKVTPEKRQGHSNKPFQIASEHRTCFFMFYCFDTEAYMTFTQPEKNSKSTKVLETIHFECPTIFATFCGKELRALRVLLQKKAIMEFDLSNYNNPF